MSVYNPANNEWVNVGDAARILGVSKQAVRQRIYRNTIPHRKDSNGTVFVRITQHNAEDHGETHDVDNTVLLDYVATLKDRIKHLEEESSRKDHIIMSLTQRIPELEPPQDTPSERRGSPETSEAAEGPESTTTPQEAQRGFWRRLLLGG